MIRSTSEQFPSVMMTKLTMPQGNQPALAAPYKRLLAVALSVALFASSFPATLAADLSVDDGVVIKFGTDAQLVVRDRITAGKGVVLTSGKDDMVGGQTGATPQNPAAGDWRGVRLEKSAAQRGALTLNDMTLRYAGATDSAALTVRGWSPTLQALRITDSAVGLRLLDGANPAISSTSFLRNGIGLEADGNSAPTLATSQFVGNATQGLSNKTPATVIQATGNWWGHASGPKDAVGNPQGQGDAVSSGVNYGSYLTAAPLLSPSVRLIAPATYYEQHTIELDLACVNATEYRIAEGDAFAGVAFQPLSEGKARVSYLTSEGDGTKNISVQFRNAAGTVAAASVEGGVRVDTKGPQVAMASPSAGSLISSTISIDVSAQDESGIAQVDFYIDGTLVKSTATNPYTYSWDATQAPDGSHEIKIRARDSIGRITEVSRLVEVQKLSVAVTGTVSSLMNLYGAGHGSASGGGDLPFKYVFPAGVGQQFQFTPVSGQVAPRGGSDAPAGPDGGDSVGLRNTVATAGLSGISASKALYLAGVFLDDQEPSGDAPANLDFQGNTAFSTLAPQLRQVFFIGDGLTGTGTGDVQTFVAPNNATRLYLGFVDSCSNTGNGPGCYSDNSGSLSVSFTRKVPATSDTSGPAIGAATLGGNALSDGLTISRSGVFSIAVSDRSGVAKVEVSLDGQVIGNANGVDVYSMSFDIGAVANGTHAIGVRAFDSIGNVSSATYSITVTHAVPDAPVLSQPVSGSTTRTAQATVSGTAKAGASVQLLLNGQAVGSVLMAGSDGRFSGSATLVSGANRLQATATDAYGTSTPSAEIVVTLDLSVPASPTNLKAAAQTAGKVHLAWTRSTDPNAVGYNLYRAATAFATTAEAQKLNASPLTTNAYDDMPPADGTWTYRVVSVNNVGTPSVPSNAAQALSDSALPRAVKIAYASSGKVDAATGRMGQGRVSVQVTLSEALQSAPYLSVVPQGGVPIAVELTKTSDTTYAGAFLIDANTPSGVANALFSARDIVGNRGTDIDAGATLKIDTEGPALSTIVLNPVAPIKNDTAQTVQTTFTFSKAPAQTPQIKYLLSGAVRTPVALTNLTRLQVTPATQYQASFTLPNDAGLGSPETLSFTAQAQDDLDNVSTQVAAFNRFQVYQGNLPPLGVPFGFSAKAQAAGKVKLAWQAVDDASGYQLYRQGPGQNELQALARTSGLDYLDQTPSDGAYKYAVASIRQSNGQETVSGMSATVDVQASATAPGAPQNLSLTLTGQGIYAAWQAPLASTPDSYNLYRTTGTQITSLDGLAPLKTRIKTPQTYDTNPSPTQGAYVVTSVDAAGNESAMSNSAYLNASLLPVRNLHVEQLGSNLPVITWAAPNGNLAGYLVYVGSQANPVKLTPSAITDTRYTDTGYTAGERRYTIATVDANGVEMPRTLLLPSLSTQIVAGLPIKRGIMNKLQVQVANTSAATLTGVRVVVRLPIDKNATQFKDHKSEALTLAPNQTRLVSVIVGGYAELPTAAPAQVGVEIAPNEGELVKIARDQTVDVTEGSLVVGMATDAFTRGGTGKLKLTIENTTDVDVELLTATNNGAGDSTELRFKLLDADGNVLATQPYKQVFGANVVTLTNGQTVARIPAGANYVSDVFNLNVPAASPNSIRVKLDVDKLRYHSGQEDEVQIAGRGSEKTVSLLDTAYYGEVTDVSPISSFGDQDIVITGRALDRASQSALPNTRLKLILNQQGFERNFSVLTDGAGNFAYTFKPTLTDAGLYKVSAVHPDITDRPEQKAFTLNRVTVGPTPYKLDIPKNYTYNIPLTAKAGPGTAATHLRLVLNPASQLTGQLPAGINVQLPGAVSLTERQTLNIPVGFTANNDAQPSGSLILDVISDEHAASPLGQVKIDYTLSEAKPYLVSTPSFVETGLAQGGSQVESVQVKNNGLQDALNLLFTLTKADGTPAPTWASLASQANGTLAVGQSRSIDLAFAPPAGTAEGVYEFKLNVAGDNVPSQALNVYVSLTQSGQGNVLFKASDIYTATVGKDGKLIPGLAGATVTVQNEDVPTVSQELLTDALGEALFQNLPAGRYKFRAKANNHQEAGGRLIVKPGITANQPVFLDYNLVTVEWSVREITIQDRYEITLNATFETDVPAPVVVMQPTSTNLPKMAVGDVYYGELTLTNFGLVRAEHVTQQLPKSDNYFRYEFLVDVPGTLEAKQRVTIPYRVIALQSLEGAASSASASGGGCYSYSATYTVGCDYTCANGNRSNCGASSSWFSVSNSSCTGSGGTGGGGASGGGGGWGGGAGGWGGGSASTPMKLKDQKCVSIPRGGSGSGGGAGPSPGPGSGYGGSQGSFPGGSDGPKCEAQ